MSSNSSYLDYNPLVWFDISNEIYGVNRCHQKQQEQILKMFVTIMLKKTPTSKASPYFLQISPCPVIDDMK